MASEINNYIEDDWDDNKLSSRDSPTKGYYYSYSEGGTGDLLKGVYRPKWTADNGTPSSSNGVMVLGDNDVVHGTSEIVTGSFRVDEHIQGSAGGSGQIEFIAKGASGLSSNAYRIITDAFNNDYDLEERSGGASTLLVTSTLSDYQANVTKRYDRDSYGNFEFYANGVSQGTGSGTAVTESNRVVMRNGYAGPDTHFDNLLIQ